MSDCPCGSGRPLEECCGPYLAGSNYPATAEALMRSRYTAYVQQQIAYLGESLHPSYRSDYDETATRRWAESATWLRLEVIALHPGADVDEERVEFVAHYRERNLLPRRHHEIGRFRRYQGRWYYLDGEIPRSTAQAQAEPKVGRNAPCSCGSGKKFKKCCGR